MINSNLRTQLQAKINAATAATSRSDLMLMRVAAQGLNLDETNLDTLLATKINAVTSADPAVDFVEAWRSLGLDGNVQYTCPFDTAPGDVLFVDPLGNVKKERYPTLGAVSSQQPRTNEPYKGVTPSRTVKGSLVRGNIQDASGAITLSDGNIMMLNAGWNDTNSQGIIGINILSPDFVTMHQSTTVTPQIGTDYMNTSSSCVLGIWEQTANVFRVWISTVEAATGAVRKLGYFVLTYNTGSKTVAYSAGAQTLLAGDAQDWRAASPYQIQGQRYTIVRLGIITKTYCLDLQTNTVVEYTGLANQNVSTSMFDHSQTGNEYARVTYGSTVQLAKAGANTLLSLPANLTSDGCFSVSNQVYLLGPLQWLCYNNTTRVAKVVLFNSTYTTCSIWTIGTIPRALGTSLRVTKQGNLFTVYGDGRAFSFVWDGATAPTRINLSQTFRVGNQGVFDPHAAASGRIVETGTQYVLYLWNSVVRNASLQQGVRMFLQVDAAEYLPAGTQEFATVITGASAGQPCEISLRGNTVKSDILTSSIRTVHHQGLVTTLVEEERTWAIGLFFSASSTPNNSITSGLAEIGDVYAKCRQAPVLSNSSGAYLYKGDCMALGMATRYDATYDGAVEILHANGYASSSASSGSSDGLAHVAASLRSGAIMTIGSNSLSFRGEVPR